MRILLALFMFVVMPFTGIANEFSYDNVSKKFPRDSEYFAYEIAKELGKKYEASKTNLILIPAKNDKLLDNLNTFLVRHGFTLNNNADGIVVSYTFDFIDKKRAYLRLELSDGTHIGVVRTLGGSSPLPLPTMVAEEIYEPKITQNSVNNALSEINKSQVEQSFLGTTPITPMHTLWTLRPGSLMNQLDDWAKKEHWKIIWKSNYDLELNAEASFSGDFVHAVEQVFNSLHKRNNGLRVTIYKTNKVVEVIGE